MPVLLIVASRGICEGLGCACLARSVLACGLPIARMHYYALQLQCRLNALRLGTCWRDVLRRPAAFVRAFLRTF